MAIGRLGLRTARGAQASISLPPRPRITARRLNAGLMARRWDDAQDPAMASRIRAVALETERVQLQPDGPGTPLSTAAVTALLSTMDAAHLKGWTVRLRTFHGYRSGYTTGLTWYSNTGLPATATPDPADTATPPTWRQLPSPVPVWWEPTYWADVEDFETKLAEAVSGHPALADVQMTAPTTQFGEFCVKQFSWATNRVAALAAGWTLEAELAAVRAMYGVWNRVWASRRVGVVVPFNPLQIITSDGTPAGQVRGSVAHTIILMEELEQLLGPLAVAANFSLEYPLAVRGTAYSTMYNRQITGRASLPPWQIGYQTASLPNMRTQASKEGGLGWSGGPTPTTLPSTVAMGASWGASWIELPAGCQTSTAGVHYLTQEAADAANTQLVANAAPFRGRPAGYDDNGVKVDEPTVTTSAGGTSADVTATITVDHPMTLAQIRFLVTDPSGDTTTWAARSGVLISTATTLAVTLSGLSETGTWRIAAQYTLDPTPAPDDWVTGPDASWVVAPLPPEPKPAQVGLVDDGAYAAPVGGYVETNPSTWSKLRLPPAWAIALGMHSCTLNVGVNELLVNSSTVRAGRLATMLAPLTAHNAGTDGVPAWWRSVSGLPETGKATFGYYDGTDQDPAAQEAQFGRRFDLTRVYNPGGWRDRAAAGLNSVEPLRQAALFHLAHGRKPFIDLTMQQLVGARIVKVAEFWSRVAAGDFDAPGVAVDGPAKGTPYVGLDDYLLTLLRLGLIFDTPMEVSIAHEWDQANDGGAALVDAAGYATLSGSTKAWFGGGAMDATGCAVNEASHRAFFRHIVTRARQLQTLFGGVVPYFWFNPAYESARITSYGKPGWGTMLTDTGSDGGYPGHDVVYGVAFDLYNTAGYSGHGWTWRTPAQIWATYGGPWWNANFKVGGKATLAQVTGTEGVYKPAALLETGTNEQWALAPYNSGAPFTGTTNQDAGQWMGALSSWLAPGGTGSEKVKHVIWWGQNPGWNGTIPGPTSTTGMNTADMVLQNNPAVCAQRWPALATMGSAAVHQTARSSRPAKQLRAKVRLHGGSRQLQEVKDACGTVTLVDGDFGQLGSIPRHWYKTADGTYPFRVAYEQQMAALAAEIDPIDDVDTVVVCGNAVFYPEPFVLNVADRRGWKFSLTTTATTLHPGTLAKTVTVTNAQAGQPANTTDIVVTHGAVSKTLTPGDSLDITTAGTPITARAVSGTAKIGVLGETNGEALLAAGWTDAEHRAYFRWLATAHKAFKRTRVELALNPYITVNASGGAGLTDSAFTISVANDFIVAMGPLAQIANYSYRIAYLKVNAPATTPYGAIYDAMEKWAAAGVSVGVQMARPHRVGLPETQPTKAWDRVAREAAVTRGYGFVETTGPAAGNPDGKYNDWPGSYETDPAAFLDITTALFRNRGVIEAEHWPAP